MTTKPILQRINEAVERIDELDDAKLSDILEAAHDEIALLRRDYLRLLHESEVNKESTAVVLRRLSAAIDEELAGQDGSYVDGLNHAAKLIDDELARIAKPA